ncbi:transcriptional adapter 1-like [Anopheles cruzii]|uniref:transcriptional adapter 1-like n=1 Tax=Anopheles cruzii TaxID=68878 RepID=UPI0022EC37C5|nr:transcriptional adapter 1-like [Anopheles cruzii]
MSSQVLNGEVEGAKQALILALGDKWTDYLANMKLWFRTKKTKEEFDIESRKLLNPNQTHLHNRFLLTILNKIDAASPPQTSSGSNYDGLQMVDAAGTFGNMNDGSGYGCHSSLITQHDARSGKKRKRSSKSSSDRSTFQPISLHEYITRIPIGIPENDPSCGQQSGLGTVPTIRYAAQELFLPDSGLVLGRLLVGAWEHGLASADDSAVELIVNSVQVLLKNILSAVIMARKHYKHTANGTFFYDVGCELKHPFDRNTVTKRKIDDEPMELDKEITTVCYLKPPPGESIFLASCEQLYPTVCRKITAYELYKVLQDRNIIPSHSVYSMNIERISSQLS